MSRLRRLALLALLAPVFPAFMWGPFTHVAINRAALKRAKELARDGDPAINAELVGLLSSSDDVERSYVLAANSADAISSYHTLNGADTYDYAHNSVPDDVRGLPSFGYTLVDTWRRTPEAAWPSGRDRLRGLAISCGWLSHQLADWHAHYACVDGNGSFSDPPDVPADEVNTFSGYSNSHRVFGHDYAVPHLRRYNLADHGLAEFLVDSALIFTPEGHRFESLSLPGLPLLGNGSNIITMASEEFDGEVRLAEDHVPVLWRNMDLILLGMYILQEFVRARRQFIRREAAAIVHAGHVDLSVERVVDGLFRKSFGEIARLARLGRRVRPPHQPIGPLRPGVSRYPGTILFKVAFSLGSSVSGFTSPGVAGAGARMLPRNAAIGGMLATLDKGAGAATRFESLRMPPAAIRAPAVDALLVMADQVLLKRRSIEEARRHFADVMKPVVTVVRRDGSDLPGGRELPTSDEVAAMIHRHRELVFKIWPAAPARGGGDLTARKALDPASLRVNINGFPVSDHPEFARLTAAFEDGRPSSPLLIRLALGPAFRPGRYDIFVDAADKSGVRAEYLHWTAELGQRAL